LERLPTLGPLVCEAEAGESGRMPPSVRTSAAAQFLQYLESF
jgi:hypothetical protein